MEYRNTQEGREYTRIKLIQFGVIFTYIFSLIDACLFLGLRSVYVCVSVSEKVFLDRSLLLGT